MPASTGSLDLAWDAGRKDTPGIERALKEQDFPSLLLFQDMTMKKINEKNCINYQY